MQLSFARIKKLGLYFFAIVGVITVSCFVVRSFLTVYEYWTGRMPLYSETGPLGLPSSISQGLPKISISEREVALEETGLTTEETIEGALTERKIIKSGFFSLLVKKAEETAKAIQEIAKELEGFVSSSWIWEVSEGVKSGSVTIRVPADRFETATEEIKKLAVKIESETTDTKDVTEEFIDLEARLKNLRAEEEQYLEIMKTAETVEDTLAVSERLYDVRGRIEQIEGQLKYLSRQVEMSSITVSFTSEAEVEVFGIRWRPLFIVKQSFKNMLTGLTGFINTMIRVVFALPVISLWLLTIFVVLVTGWRFLGWFRKRFFSRKKNKK